MLLICLWNRMKWIAVVDAYVMSIGEAVRIKTRIPSNVRFTMRNRFNRAEGDSYYLPLRSWGKVIFSAACVKNSVHGGEGVCPLACWDTPPRTRDRPPPGSRPPQRSACWEMQATSGRYAPYWNAYLIQWVTIHLQPSDRWPRIWSPVEWMYGEPPSINLSETEIIPNLCSIKPSF